MQEIFFHIKLKKPVIVFVTVPDDDAMLSDIIFLREPFQDQSKLPNQEQLLQL